MVLPQLEVERDAWELEWWRSVFATRFRPGVLPAVGSALYGKRYDLVVLNPED